MAGHLYVRMVGKGWLKIGHTADGLSGKYAPAHLLWYTECSYPRAADDWVKRILADVRYGTSENYQADLRTAQRAVLKAVKMGPAVPAEPLVKRMP